MAASGSDSPLTPWRLVAASLRYYWPTHLLVVAGVAVAASVLAGALVVGDSVRASLRALAVERLGRTDLAVSSTTFVREALAEAVTADPAFGGAFAGLAPLAVLEGTVTHERSRRTAHGVRVYGVDDRFARFQAVAALAPGGRDALLSPALARDLEAQVDDGLILRVARPTDIPLSTLYGRRDEAGVRIRLRAARVLDATSLGEFSLAPTQVEVRAIFVPLARLQQDLGLAGRVNAFVAALGPDAPADPRATEATLARLVHAHASLADLGLRLRAAADGRALVVESPAGLVADPLARAVQRVADNLGAAVVPVLTHLANTIATDRASLPYSTVSALDLTHYARLWGPPDWLPAQAEATAAGPYIWLNEWAAAELRPEPGEIVALEYYLWSDERGLETRTSEFLFAGIVPMAGAGGDRTLTPEYPGITDADRVTSWDPPFPIDLGRVRDRDEAYWERWRAAPKAFVALPTGQFLWPSVFGSVTSLRVVAPEGQAASAFAELFGERLRDAIRPADAGLQVRAVRADSLAAAQGTTDFGEYFVYFSAFLVASGLLLAYLFFALGLEQRAREAGLLAAVGFTPADLRRHFLREGAVLAALGGVLGAIGALGYARLVVYGLRTWWVDAVNTSVLEVHVGAGSLAAGALLPAAAGLAALGAALRTMARRSTRALLAGAVGSGLDLAVPPSSARWWRLHAAAVLAVAAAIAVALAALGVLPHTPAFFGAGTALLGAGLAAASARLWAPSQTTLAPGTPALLARFGLRHARWRPTRSVLSLALVAFAVFVLVTVGAFRRDPAAIALARDAGTGGYVLMAESVAPLLHDPNTAAGRAELGLPEDALAGVRIARFRLRPGDDASCLTLYRPQQPRILAPAPEFIAEGRFRFAASLADTPDERANPWRLLDRRFPDGAIPVVVDATSLAYVLHRRVGDDLALPLPGGGTATLRIVAALADSVFQSELLMGEAAFVRLFPRHEGYRVWLLEAPEERAAELATLLEDRLADFGVDVVDTRARLAAYHRVENTYLSTFQALGTLGLLVGTLGLGAVLARNALERRRELGLLRAVGYEPVHLRWIVLAEGGGLLAGGLLLGSAAALVAIAPALAGRAGAAPWGTLLGVGALVFAAGSLATLAAVRLASRSSVVEAVKTE